MLDIIRGKAQSFGVKLAFAIIIIVFVFWGVGGLGGPVVSHVVTVNDTPISEQDFMRQYEQAVRALERQSPEIVEEITQGTAFRERILQQMVLQTLLLDEAEHLGLAVTPIELRKAIETISVFQNEEGQFDPDAYKRVIGAQGQSLAFFENMLRRDLLVQKLQQQVTAGAYVSEAELKNIYLYNAERRKIDYVFFPFKEELGGLTITPEAMQTYYDENKYQLFNVAAHMELDAVLIGVENLAKTLTIDDAKVKEMYENTKHRYEEPEQVHARHIIFLLDEDATPEDVAAIEKRMTDLVERLEKGEAFEALAKEYSEDASASNGGDLGYFSREQMVEPFAVAAFALEKGAVSEPVRTQFGYHLIKKEDYKPAGVRPYADVADELREQLAQDEAAGNVQDTLDQFLLAVIGGKELAQAAEELKLSVETIKRMPIEEIARMWQLKPEQLDNLTKMPVGAVFETPFVTPTGYLLVHPKVFEPATVASLESVKKTIEDTLRRDEAVKLATKKAQATLDSMHKVKATQEAKDAKLVVPAPLASRMQQLTLGHDGDLGELGTNMDLVKAAFAAELDSWLPQPFAVNGGSIMVRVVERELPDDGQWQMIQGLLEETVLDAQKEQMFQAFVNMLRAKAVIEMHNQRVLME